MTDGEPSSPSIRKLLVGGILCNGELLSKFVRLLLTTFVVGIGVGVKSRPPVDEFYWVDIPKTHSINFKFYPINQANRDLMMDLNSLW